MSDEEGKTGKRGNEVPGIERRNGTNEEEGPKKWGVGDGHRHLCYYNTFL